MTTSAKTPTARKRARGNQRETAGEASTPRKAKVVAADQAARPERTEPGRSKSPLRQSKKSTVIGLLQRPDGAAISELTEATGGQAHSVRAALTGLRKAGGDLVREKDAAWITRYRLAITA